jgi:hypothetical protein
VSENAIICIVGMSCLTAVALAAVLADVVCELLDGRQPMARDSETPALRQPAERPQPVPPAPDVGPRPPSLAELVRREEAREREALGAQHPNYWRGVIGR